MANLAAFSAIAKKRRRAAPPFFALFLNFPENFRPRSPKIRSPGQVKWPHLRKKNYNRVTATVVERKIWSFQDLVYYQVPTNCIPRISFLYRWPKVRSISLPPHYKSMGKTQMPQILIRSVQIAQNYAQLGYCWWPRCNFAHVTPGKVIRGQIITSRYQCTFLLITFDWNEIETWGRF